MLWNSLRYYTHIFVPWGFLKHKIKQTSSNYLCFHDFRKLLLDIGLVSSLTNVYGMLIEAQILGLSHGHPQENPSVCTCGRAFPVSVSQLSFLLRVRVLGHGIGGFSHAAYCRMDQGSAGMRLTLFGFIYLGLAPVIAVISYSVNNATTTDVVS